MRFFEKLLKGGVWKCGFVEAKPSSFYSEGFMCTKPLEFDDDWVETAERLFGAYKPGSFFNANILENKECLVGEPVDVRTLIKSSCGDVQISGLKLKIVGCDAKVTEATIARTAVADVNLSFIPQTPGTLTVSGVEFKWGQGVDFYVDFQTPLVFTVFEKAPSIKLSVSSSILLMT